jgi:hypothetical protein
VLGPLGRTHSLFGEGVGVNILEDARHTSVLYICKYFVAYGIEIHEAVFLTVHMMFFHFSCIFYSARGCFFPSLRKFWAINTNV